MLNLKIVQIKCVPFKIYADFECIFKKCDNVVGSCDCEQKKVNVYRVVLGTKLFVLMIDLVNML